MSRTEEGVAQSTRSPLSSSTLIIKLVVRALALLLLFISLIILTTVSGTLFLTIGNFDVKFNDIYAYRYMLFSVVLGLVYSLLQTAFTIFNITSGQPMSNALSLFNFYGDLVLLYALATGAAAGFGATMDLQVVYKGVITSKFFEMGNASAAMLFLGSICSAASLVFSAYGLHKRI